MDTNLNDDLIKLVRFSVVSIERDRERVLRHGEQLVLDAMSGEAFSSWMVAVYLQSTDVPIQEEEKKYLCVCFAVLCRWPKQDREFEKRQIEVLDEIREALARRPEPKPKPEPEPKTGPDGRGLYAEMMQRLDGNRGLLLDWRHAFQRCRGAFSSAVAEAFNEHRNAGTFQARQIDADALRVAFKEGVEAQKGLHPRTLDRFAGRSRGEFLTYDLRTDGALGGPTMYREWERTRESGGALVQRTTVSARGYLEPAEVGENPGDRADVTINVHREDLGLVSWASNFQQGRQEMPFICYPLGKDALLWIAQLMSERLDPLFPGAFLVFHKWPGRSQSKRFFSLVAFSFAFDFEACSAGVIGDTFWKGRFEVESEQIP